MGLGALCIVIVIGVIFLGRFLLKLIIGLGAGVQQAAKESDEAGVAPQDYRDLFAKEMSEEEQQKILEEYREEIQDIAKRKAGEVLSRRSALARYFNDFQYFKNMEKLLEPYINCADDTEKEKVSVKVPEMKNTYHTEEYDRYRPALLDQRRKLLYYLDACNEESVEQFFTEVAVAHIWKRETGHEVLPANYCGHFIAERPELSDVQSIIIRPYDSKYWKIVADRREECRKIGRSRSTTIEVVWGFAIVIQFVMMIATLAQNTGFLSTMLAFIIPPIIAIIISIIASASTPNPIEHYRLPSDFVKRKY